MSKSFREGLIAMLEEYRQAPPEGTQEELKDTYKGITLEDAKRVKEGLTALLDSKTRKEQRQREREAMRASPLFLRAVIMLLQAVSKGNETL